MNFSSEKKHELITLIYSTINQPEKWIPTIEQTCKLTTANAAYFYVYTIADNTTECISFERSASKDHSNNQETEIHAWKQQHLKQWKPSAPEGSGEIISHFQRRTIPKHLRTTQHSQHIASRFSDRENRYIAELLLFRSTSQQPFTTSCINNANSYLPFIAQATTLSLITQIDRAAHRDSSIFIRSMPVAAVHIDDKGHIIYKNKQLELLANNGLLISPQKKNELKFQNAEHQESFTRMIKEAKNYKIDQNTPFNYYYIPHQKDHYRITLKPRRFHSPNIFHQKTKPGYVVSIRKCASNQTIQPEDILQIFPLTKAEAHICSCLCNGSSLEEIATIRATGIATIRQQIKSCLTKTETRNQTDMLMNTLRTVLVL